MTVKINDKDYKFEFQSQVGVNYKYEIIFGSTYVDDLDKLSNSIITIRLAYAILALCNRTLDISFDDFVEYVTLDNLREMNDYTNDRLAIINQENNEEITTEEEGEKKD